MSRDGMIARIRNARTGRAPDDDNARRAAVEARLREAPRGLLPARAVKLRGTLVGDFKRRMADQLALVEELASAALVPTAVARVLEAAHLPPDLKTGADPRIAGLPWATALGVTRHAGAAGKADMAALTYAVAGIAETGTLMLASGPDNPVTLSFLPELEIVAVDESTIVGSLEDAFALLHRGAGARAMPRTVNLVSAASRTGDIGGRLVMGAHGPRQLVVLVLKSNEGAQGAPS